MYLSCSRGNAMLKRLYRELELVYKPEDIHKLHKRNIKFNEWDKNKVDDFNQILDWLRENAVQFSWSDRGFISNRRGFRLPAYNIIAGNFWIDLTVVSNFGICRIQVRFTEDKPKEQDSITGSQAFILFRNFCKQWGIDLKKYEIDNGAEVKETIPKYLIWMEPRVRDFVYKGVAHHIDFHSSFPAGLANTHPEFRPILEWLYTERKNDPTKKAILNYSIGYMQSLGGCQARWAHLAKDAIEDNNKRINELVTRLKKAGRTVVGLNTDGIWYVGKIYHGEGEGSGLGQWENDHINCDLRYKTAGCYEFMEDGVYHPVVRGLTSYDAIVPREQWQWGDIYRHTEYITYYWNGKEIIKTTNTEE